VTGLALVLGGIAALVAGAGAYLITLDEMQHHVLPPKAQAEAGRRAGVTVAFFLALGVALAVALPAWLPRA
jgi:heme/copper-type cytochrome/quinol oxidase subunit 2